jgi:hypothetical protein
MRKLILAALAGATLVGAGAASAQVVVERYGHWDPAWGAAPPPPPARVTYWRHHRHENEWYEHVHNCMTHERYDARRDMYFEHRHWVACH